LTCFRAKGRPETRRLVVEWQEKDNSRWIASVELGTEWKDYALPPEAFRPWLPPAGRGGPGDRFRVENAVRFQIGLATSHSELRSGFHEFWFDDLSTTRRQPDMVAAKGVVSTIVDGETLIVSGVGNVRLAGIRALRDPSRKPRPDDDLFGDEAERAVRRLAAGHNVRLEIESVGSDSAVPLSRTSNRQALPALAWVFLEDGSLLNEQLVRRGYARVSALRDDARYAARLKAAETEARTARRGLWPKQKG
jgi:endonuclease YncB( thermonuclease family)